MAINVNFSNVIPLNNKKNQHNKSNLSKKDNPFHLIKDQVSIVEVWNRFIGKDLKKVGNNFKTNCIFHNEKDPSLYLNREGNYFHCFGCHEGGDPINLVAKYKNISNYQALKLIADEFNIIIPNVSEKEIQEIKINRKQKEKLNKLYLSALKYFRNKLGKKQINWLLEKYPLTEDLIKKHGLGYCPGGLLKKLKNEGFDKELLKESGLFKIDKNGNLKDRYFKRIMIPYFENGKIVYFTGRHLKDQKEYKYLKLKGKESPVFWGNREHNEKLIITEGEIDAIIAGNQGYDAIAIGKNLSTNKVDKLVQLVKKYKEVIIINDSEEDAFESALNTARNLMVNTGKQIKIGKIPFPGFDISELINNNGNLNQVVKKAKTWIDWLISSNNLTVKIFSNQENLKTLALIKKNHINLWAIIKDKLSGNINLNDLKAAVNQFNKNTEQNRENQTRIVEKNDGYYDRKRNMLRLSNFVLDIKERLILPNGEELFSLKGIKINGDYFPLELDLTNSDLNYPKKLKEQLGKNRTAFFGTERDIDLIRDFLALKDIPDIQGSTVIGIKDDFLCLSEVTYKQTGTEIIQTNELKLIKDKEMQQTNIFKNSIQQLNYSSEAEYHAAKTIFQILPTVHKPSTMFLISSWLFVLPFNKKLREEFNEGFPFLSLFGRQGCGKTSLTRVVLRAFGLKKGHTPNDASETTPFAMIINCQRNNLLPYWIDDYRPGELKKKGSLKSYLSFLRAVYDGKGAQKGTSNQELKGYNELHSPVFHTSEVRPREDEALNERQIPVRLVNKYKSKDKFNKLKESSLEAFALPYWKFCLTLEDWKEIFLEKKEEVERLFQAKNLPANDRIQNNIAIILFGDKLRKRFAKHLGIEIKEPENVRIDAINEVIEELLPEGGNRDKLDTLMKEIDLMVRNDYLVEGVDYKRKTIQGEDEESILLRFEDIFKDRIPHYNRNRGLQKEYFSFEEYKKLIDERAEDKNSYIKVKYKDNKARAQLKKTKESNEKKYYRGLLIDPDKLEKKLNIDCNLW